MKIKALSILSTKGSRPCQEDFVSANKDRGIFVVADGFGGPRAGREAAEESCKAVREFLEREAGDEDATLPFELRNYYSLAGNIIFNALIYANKKLLRLNQERSIHDKGGASVVAAYVDGPILAIASVGACSAYLIRGGREVSLLQSRSYGRMIDPLHWEKQRQKREELAVPMMALGMSQDLEPEITEYRLQVGDWLLLHTDGLKPSTRSQFSGIQGSRQRLEVQVNEVNHLVKTQDSVDNTAISLSIF